MISTEEWLIRGGGVQVVVFNLYTPGNIMRALCGDEDVGTTICNDGNSYAKSLVLRS